MVTTLTNDELETCVRKLIYDGFVGYGITIPKEKLQYLFEMKYSETWEWRGPVLQLRSHLNEMGYFISERGVDEGGIRFLSENEIPEALEKRRKSRYRRICVDLNVAHKLPLLNLGSRHQAQLRYERDRIGRDLSALTDDNSELRKQMVSE